LHPESSATLVYPYVDLFLHGIHRQAYLVLICSNHLQLQSSLLASLLITADDKYSLSDVFGWSLQLVTIVNYMAYYIPYSQYVN
jgi:hypothetical protein